MKPEETVEWSLFGVLLAIVLVASRVAAGKQR